MKGMMVKKTFSNLIQLLIMTSAVCLTFLSVNAASQSSTNSTTTTEDGSEGIDELDAVIEFDDTDDLFMLLTARESSCVHLYTRKDPQYLAKRKAYRKAAKRDIDANQASKVDPHQVTQWISIDKEMLMEAVKGRHTKHGDDADEEIDDEKLMQVFGVHQPLTYYGYMNMKASSGFPIAQSGDHLVEDAVEAILIEKAKRI